MSRDRAWINTDRMEREDVAYMMTDEMVDIKLWRYNKLSSDDGFRKQAPGEYLELIKTIKGRIDRRQQIYQPRDSEAAKVTDHLFIATVYYRDLRTNDQLEVAGQMYRVQFINKIGQGFTEAELEVQT